MFDHLLTEEQRCVRDDAREFVKATPRQLILDMDAETVRVPKEWLREAGRRNLLGVRHPRQRGGGGMDWATTCAVSEEIGSLSYELACVFGVGADLVSDAILIHGTPAQKARYVTPLLKADIFAAECLTEPRGGSDVFGATSTERRPLPAQRPEAFHRRRRGSRLFSGLCPHRHRP
jgi:butyryl-CoA dehydrogenase